MKKTLSFFLSMVLLISISFSALAADSAATDLEKITAAVKTKLSIDDKYNNFNGDLNDYGMSKSYNLFWSGENRNLSVQVSETGKILNYSRSEENDYSSDYNSLRESNIPKFPSTESAEKAKKLAQDFLKKVLEQNESCDIALEENIFRDVNFYSFSNTLKINSVKTPISVSVTVNLKGGFVSSFFRSDAYDKYLGTPPSPTNLTDKTAALQKLKEKTAINLVYARDYQSGTQTKTALLRYVPSFSWNLCVDAKTGSLVDMNEVYEEVNRNGATENAKATSDAGMGGSEPQNSLALTEYEKKLIENLKTVLSKEKLDQIARNVPEFGLSSDYKVSYSSYFKPDDQKEDISFSINYSKQQKNDAGYTYFLEKNVTLDAKTGEILSFNTYSSENSKATNKLTSAEAKKKAEAFLKKYSAKELQDSMEYNGDIFLTQESSYAPFCFARKVNDIPFPENSLNISIDRTTGDISYYYKNKWEDGITFEEIESMIPKPSTPRTP